MFDMPIDMLFIMVLQYMIKVLLEPFFYIVVFLVYWQCRSLMEQQYYLFGQKNIKLSKMVAEFTGIGIIGGIFASMIMVITGLPINNIGLEYLWPLAIFLLFVNARFICFAYAGGLIALSSIIFGWPYIEASHVLALVAILHVTESVLVFLGSTFSALPVYIMHKGKAAGAFMLTSFWPLPLLMMISISLPTHELGEFLKMPDWWPLFPYAQPAPEGHSNVLLPIAFAAVLGYSSIAVTKTPKEKRQFSAMALFVYSICLFAFAYLSIDNYVFGILAALVSIGGHELVVYLDQQMEKNGEAIYQGSPDRFVVLSTIYKTPAYRAGIKAGDVIVKLNDNTVFDERDIALVTRYLPIKFSMEVLRNGKIIKKQAQFLDGEEKILGLIRMPVKGRDRFLEIDGNYSFIRKWLRKLKRWHA